MQISLSIICLFLLLNFFHLNEEAIEWDGITHTKMEVLRDSLAIANRLMDKGLKAGDKIAILMSNCYEGIIYNIAANAIGVDVVILNYNDTAQCLSETIILHENISFVIADMRDFLRLNTMRSYCDINGGTQFSIIYATRIYRKATWNLTAFAKIITLLTVIRNMSNKNTTVFLQTSGSSGKSKDLPFSNRNIFAALMYCSKSVDIKIRDKVFRSCLCAMPYRLPYGWGMIFVNLIGGQKVILAEGIDSAAFGNFYKSHPDVIYGTPTILRGMIDNTPKNADLSNTKIFFSGGFSMPAKWYQEGIKFFKDHGADKIQICNDYGFGEGLCIGTSSKDMPFTANSVGKFFIGPEWRIVGEDLQEVPLGSPGEIIVHADSICKEYFKNPDATKKHFITIDGKTFFRTGDLAYQDGRKTVFFVDRAMRFYLPIGAPEKVYCSYIEKIVAELDFVKSCAVVPVDGVQGAVFVVLKDDFKNSKDYQHEYNLKIAKYLEDKLLPYQKPSKVSFLYELPLSSSGKIDYLKLQNLSSSV